MGKKASAAPVCLGVLVLVVSLGILGVGIATVLKVYQKPADNTVNAGGTRSAKKNIMQADPGLRVIQGEGGLCLPSRDRLGPGSGILWQILDIFFRQNKLKSAFVAGAFRLTESGITVYIH